MGMERMGRMVDMSRADIKHGYGVMKIVECVTI